MPPENLRSLVRETFGWIPGGSRDATKEEGRWISGKSTKSLTFFPGSDYCPYRAKEVNTGET